MTFLGTVATLVTLTAVFAYLNRRFIGLASTIGITLGGLVMSIGIIVLDRLGIGIGADAQAVWRGVDFDATVINGMLSFVLFAGALRIDVKDLAAERWPVALLPTVGVAVSIVMVGWAVHTLAGWLGPPLPLSYCLLFGALISPTDPIAVLSILKSLGVQKSLETKMAGEAMFNDGIGIVAFIALLEFAAGEQPSLAGTALLLAEEVGGGVLFGFAMGWLAYRMMRSIDDYPVEILLTLAVVTGGYTLAAKLGLSGPVAVVIAGLMIGSQGRQFAMSDETRHNLEVFWEVVDEVLTAVLFVLIGLEVLALPLELRYLGIAALAIPAVLLARLVAISVVAVLPGVRAQFSPYTVKVLTWGGLRGAISIALALSIPHGAERDALVIMTYAVVVFSILVQGLTIRRVLRPTP